MNKSHFLAFVLWVVCGLTVYAFPQEGPDSQSETAMTYVGSALWSDMSDLSVVGDFAYCAMRPGLLVLDVSDPSLILPVSQVYLPPGPAEEVVVYGSYAYLRTREPKLYIINISDPRATYVVGSCNISKNARDIAVSEDCAYVAIGSRGLQFINIAKPEAPHVVCTVSVCGSANNVTLEGEFLYVNTPDSGFHVIDVSDPESPNFVGRFSIPDMPRNVAVRGKYAYVAKYDAGFQTYDITLPAPLILLGACSTLGTAYTVTVAGDYAYVSEKRGHDGFHLGGPLWHLALQIINVTDPANPKLVGSFSDLADRFILPSGISVVGHYAYIADEESGLYVIDVTDPVAPTVAGRYYTPTPRNVTICGRYAYVLACSKVQPALVPPELVRGYLHIYDISLDTVPQLVFSTNAFLDVVDVEIDGRLAYLGGGIPLVQVVNLAEPQTLDSIASCVMTGQAKDLVLAGNYAYMTDYYRGLYIIDLVKPDAFKVVGIYDTPGHAVRVTVIENYAYVADGDSGLLILDVSDSKSPIKIGSYCQQDYAAYAVDIAVDSVYAYVAGGASGLWIINIANPQAPSYEGGWKILGSSGVFVHVNSVVVSEGYAYVGTSSGVHMFDVSNPKVPRLLCSYGACGSVATLKGDFLYGVGAGLFVLRVNK